MTPSLLHYRSWQGTFRSPWWSVWPIARVALGILLRRRLFWALYGFSLLLFFMFFFGSFMLGWAESQIGNTPLQIGKLNIEPRKANEFIRQRLRILNGSRETFSYFFAYQGTMVVVILTLTGSLVVGNDFNFRSLPFYLAKPISRWQYILGKCLAVGIVVNLLTTVPSLVLYAQHGFEDFEYFTNPDYFDEQNPPSIQPGVPDPTWGKASWPLLLGVLGYGLVLSVFLSLLLVATATWMRRTMPLIVVWMSLFAFLRILSSILVDALKYDVHWKLLDLWNDLGIVGQACLGYPDGRFGSLLQPSLFDAALVLCLVSAICLMYLNQRTRAVEIVR